jgi:hypothetical protein
LAVPRRCENSARAPALSVTLPTLAKAFIEAHSAASGVFGRWRRYSTYQCEKLYRVLLCGSFCSQAAKLTLLLARI